MSQPTADDSTSLAKQTSPSSRQTGWMIIGGIIVVALLAISLRWIYAEQVLRQNDVPHLRRLHADSRGYLSTGQRLANGETYVDFAVPRSREQGLVRPPMYPAFLAILLKPGFSFRGIFITQAWIGAMVPAMVFALGLWIWGHKPAGVFLSALAGMMSAFSGTGIAISSIVLTDLLFSALFLAGFMMMLRSVHEPRWPASALAGVLFALATLTKPTTMLWPLVSVAVWFALSRGAGQPFRLRNLAILFLIQVACIGAWCMRNFTAEGLFTFSTITERNLRFEVAPTVEEWARLKRFPTQRQVRPNLARVRDEATQLTTRPDMVVADYVRWQRDGAMAIIQAHPFLTMGVMASNAINQLTTGWRDFDTQLPQNGWISNLAQRLDSFWFPEKHFCYALLVAMIAAFIPARRDQQTDAKTTSWNRWVVLSLLVTFLYFALLSGTTRDQGSRILYPVEFARIILLIEALRRLWTWRGSLKTAR